jgi:hypothetical protein
VVRAALGCRMTADSTLARLLRWATPERPIELSMSRNNLPTLCCELGFTRGAEIGVWKGAFTAAFCEAHPSIHMLAVDPWLSYPAWLDTKNSMPPDQAVRIMEEAYGLARARLAPFNCTIVRAFSAEAARDVPDGSLDFVYIDGNHVEEAVYEDLALWAPKVRSGGFVAGHDYRAFKNKPTIHVIEAVQRYTAQHAIDPWFITAGDRTPSFLWVIE